MKTVLAALLALSTLAAVVPANATVNSGNLTTFDGPAFGPADIKGTDGPAFGPADLKGFDGPAFGPSDVRGFDGPAHGWDESGNQRGAVTLRADELRRLLQQPALFVSGALVTACRLPRGASRSPSNSGSCRNRRPRT